MSLQQKLKGHCNFDPIELHNIVAFKFWKLPIDLPIVICFSMEHTLTSLLVYNVLLFQGLEQIPDEK